MTDENNNISIFTEDRFEPCRVCGEPSSGWHCGAVTCEACKKFFLRSINGEDTKYKCIRNKDCVIVRTTRTQCQYCRFQKCKEVGMTINENPNNPTVAEIFKGFACHVCKAPSSGVHFGAITCEGCKGFFRRSIKERAPERYRCMENGNCEISAATRNMCRHCRYQRCIKAGMSAQNSRIGRQSNLFKHNIIEWQSRGLTPNSEYILTQRKVKKVKTESNSNINGNINPYMMGPPGNGLPGDPHCSGNLNFGPHHHHHHNHQHSHHLNHLNHSHHSHSNGPSGPALMPNTFDPHYEPMNPMNPGCAGPPHTSFNNSNGPPAHSGLNGPPGLPGPPPIGGSYMSAGPGQSSFDNNNNNSSNNSGPPPPLGGPPNEAMQTNAMAIPSTTTSTNNSNYNTGSSGSGNSSSTNSSGNSSSSSSSSNYYSWPSTGSGANSNNNYNEFSSSGSGSNGVNNNNTNGYVDHNNPSVQNNNINNNNGRMIQQQQQQQQQPPFAQPAALLPPSSSNSNSSSNSSSSSPTTPGVEDSFDKPVKQLITKISQSYRENLFFVQDMLITEHVPYLINLSASFNPDEHANSSNSMQYVSHLNPLVEVIEHLKFYAKKFVGFTQNIPGLGNLVTEDKEELVKCSIHSVVLLALQRKCTNYNYFNCDQLKLEKYTHIFPIFLKANNFMKAIHEKFEKYKLDEKEYSLFAALLVISTASKYLRDYGKIMEIREQIGTALRQYMFARRNEEITCDEILLMLVIFRRFNLILQREITASYFAIKKADESAFQNYLFFPKVFLSNQLELK